MLKQSFGYSNVDIKDSIRLQKQKKNYDERKKLLRENLKKRKNKKNLTR